MKKKIVVAAASMIGIGAITAGIMAYRKNHV